jgi:predicted alpha/beta hydrolase
VSEALRGTANAADGVPLAITRFPAQGRAWATMLLAPAMGVRQDFYAPLARFAAQRGIHVLTFDYRGSGASRRGPLRAEAATLSDWCDRDLDAMLDEASRMGPGLPLLLVGHSLGGQFLGAASSNRRVRAAATVTAGSGWYGFNDRIPLQVRFLWFVAMPLLTPLFGYFPGRMLRIVGNLPRGVAMQWRRWCLHRDYLLIEGAHMHAAFGRVSAPILCWSFEDDPLIRGPAVDHLHGFYRNARVERRHVAPADVGLEHIGHFGFFAERAREALWIPTLEWLRARSVEEVECATSPAS